MTSEEKLHKAIIQAQDFFATESSTIKSTPIYAVVVKHFLDELEKEESNKVATKHLLTDAGRQGVSL